MAENPDKELLAAWAVVQETARELHENEFVWITNAAAEHFKKAIYDLKMRIVVLERFEEDPPEKSALEQRLIRYEKIMRFLDALRDFISQGVALKFARDLVAFGVIGRKRRK